MLSVATRGDEPGFEVAIDNMCILKDAEPAANFPHGSMRNSSSCAKYNREGTICMKLFFKSRIVAMGAPVAVAVIALGTCTTVVAQTTAKKPNIVVIMADDVGWSNIGAYNQGIMYQTTPTLDQ